MLILHLKQEWFDKIRSGKKIHEYREITPYWNKRIHPTYEFNNLIPQKFIYSEKVYRHNDGIVFYCGYPPITDEKRKLYGKIISVEILKNGLNTDLKTEKPVFDIKFRIIKKEI